MVRRQRRLLPSLGSWKVRNVDRKLSIFRKKKIKSTFLNISVNNFRKLSNFKRLEYKMENLSWKQRLSKFAKRNIVLLVSVPMLISIHWGWMKLQNIEQFVPKHEKRELPILAVRNYFGQFRYLLNKQSFNFNTS